MRQEAVGPAGILHPTVRSQPPELEFEAMQSRSVVALGAAVVLTAPAGACASSRSATPATTDPDIITLEQIVRYKASNAYSANGSRRSRGPALPGGTEQNAGTRRDEPRCDPRRDEARTPPR